MKQIPQIVCADGTTLSVQAGAFHYCTPRDDFGPYITVEVGFPSIVLPDSWAEYAENKHPCDIYDRVPVALVNAFIADHGGLDVGAFLAVQA